MTFETGPGARPGRYMAIEGATGAGKSTLAKRLAPRLSAKIEVDPYFANPLPIPDGVSADAVQTALAAELAFVGLRVTQLRHIRSVLDQGRNVVADWAMLKTEVFPRISLPAPDAELVSAAARLWQHALPRPDLIIYLRASTPVLAERIRRRGRGFEQRLDAPVLCRQNALFDAVLATGPVLTVDADSFDAFDEAHITDLAERVSARISAHQRIEEAA